MIQTASIQITPEILSLVASVDEFKGAWRSLGTLAPDRLSALLRVATIESIGSSTRIEGSKLSDRGLLEAIEHAEGRAPQTRIHRPRPVDVRALRAKVRMTQEQFAARFGFSTATLRHWERGDRAPHGPALVLLNVIAHNPSAVIEALAA